MAQIVPVALCLSCRCKYSYICEFIVLWNINEVTLSIVWKFSGPLTMRCELYMSIFSLIEIIKMFLLRNYYYNILIKIPPFFIIMLCCLGNCLPGIVCGWIMIYTTPKKQSYICSTSLTLGRNCYFNLMIKWIQTKLWFLT